MKAELSRRLPAARLILSGHLQQQQLLNLLALLSLQPHLGCLGCPGSQA
jgi:hypothetical protein